MSKVLIAHPESECAFWCTRLVADVALESEPLCIEVLPSDPSYARWAELADRGDMMAFHMRRVA